MNKPPLCLSIHPDSQFARLVTRLATNPLLRTEEACKLWQQAAKGGGRTDLSPSRGSFLIDVLCDAITAQDAKEVKRGTYAVPGMRDALRTDAPNHKIVWEEKKTEILPMVTVPSPNSPGGKLEIEGPIEMIDITPDRDEGMIFPEPPVQPKKLEGFVKPEWFEEMAAALDEGMHVSLAGPPGVGKTTAPEQYALMRGQTVVTINAHGGLRYRDVAGHTQVVNGKTRFVVAEYAAAAVKGWTVVLNEVNAAEPDAILFMNGQLAPPYTININGKTYPVHKDFRVVVTYNPGLIGTKPLNDSLKDRFECFKVTFPGPEVLLRMLRANGLTPELEERFWGGLSSFTLACNQARVKGQMRYQLSTRRLYSTVRHLARGRSFEEALTLGVLNAVDTLGDLTKLTEIRNAVAQKHELR